MSEHIKVELDFVPVEERLPEGVDGIEKEFLVLFNGKQIGRAWHSYSSSTEEHFWSVSNGRLCVDSITHWAKRPTRLKR